MSFVVTTPVTEEQRRAAEIKRQAAYEAQRKLEQDLIIAELLGKIAKLEGEQK